jgi:hypothetical protein
MDQLITERTAGRHRIMVFHSGERLNPKIGGWSSCRLLPYTTLPPAPRAGDGARNGIDRSAARWRANSAGKPSVIIGDSINECYRIGFFVPCESENDVCFQEPEEKRAGERREFQE